MRFLSLRKRILSRELVVGTWIQTGSTAAANIMDLFPYDWISIDMEHSDIDTTEMGALITQIKHAAPLVRVRENDTLAIRQALDNGALGVIVPLIGNAEQAKRAVAAAKYPPDGVRGFGFCRGNDWGYDFKHYIKEANEEICVIAMIESREGVENIDEILSVDGIDGIFVGPYDMSGSYGVPGQTHHPLVEAALEKLLNACAEHEKAAGLHIVEADAETVKRERARGFTFIALGTDILFIGEGAKNALSYAKPTII